VALLLISCIYWNGIAQLRRKPRGHRENFCCISSVLEFVNKQTWLYSRDVGFVCCVWVTVCASAHQCKSDRGYRGNKKRWEESPTATCLLPTLSSAAAKFCRTDVPASGNAEPPRAHVKLHIKIHVKICQQVISYIITGSPTHSVGGGHYYFTLWRLSSSVVVFTRAGQEITSCRLQSNLAPLHGNTARRARCVTSR